MQSRFKNLPIGRIIVKDKSKAKAKAVFKNRERKSLKS